MLRDISKKKGREPRGIRKLEEEGPMALKEAVKLKTIPCNTCQVDMEIHQQHVDFIGASVPDFPVRKCPKCGEELLNGAVLMSIEDTIEKHQLHGLYSIDQLIEIQENEGAV